VVTEKKREVSEKKGEKNRERQVESHKKCAEECLKGSQDPSFHVSGENAFGIKGGTFSAKDLINHRSESVRQINYCRGSKSTRK